MSPDVVSMQNERSFTMQHSSGSWQGWAHCPCCPPASTRLLPLSPDAAQPKRTRTKRRHDERFME
jgi:hypothetical protein